MFYGHDVTRNRSIQYMYTHITYVSMYVCTLHTAGQPEPVCRDKEQAHMTEMCTDDKLYGLATGN